MLDRTLKTTQTMPGPFLYKLSVAGFVLFLALTLLALVDFRRGFLFTDYIRSPYLAYHPAQVAMLGIGVGGLLLCYQCLKSFESREKVAGGYVQALTFILLGLLVVDLLTYRSVPAARALASGKLGADWLDAFGVTGWLRPIALSVSYLLTVWHATLLGILIAGLVLTVLPKYFQPFFSRKGWAGTLIGALYAVPQPFCSCCAAVMVPAYARRGASTDFSLSFVVGSPMLNITTIILAFALLPTPFAIARVLVGLILTLFVTYAVARLADRWSGQGKVSLSAPVTARLSRLPNWVSRGMDIYVRIFDVDRLVGDRKTDTPAALVSTWLYASARLALVLVPTLFLWSIVTAAIVQVLSSTLGNNLPSVVVMAITGTLMMISTWTEIPVALQLIQSGFVGPAATALVVLPPVSLPCLMLLSGSLGRFRVTVLLGLAIMVTGIAVGLLFL
jgi:uncharacterized membrane protein YraQ (UPF0718 family)